MQWPQLNQSPVLTVMIGAIAMFVGVSASMIISTRSRDGDVVIISDPTAFEIVVEIRGAVQNPGVYHLPQDARLADLLSASGGASADANLAPHNLARRLNDAEVVVIEENSSATPVVAEVVPKESAEALSISRKVNINTASQAELETLPDIGPVIAGRIIEDRTANGPYQRIEELTRVPGISENTVDDLRNLITVGP